MPQQDPDHQKLLDLGVPQHALEAAQKRGVNGRRILDLATRLLPTLLEFLGEQGGPQAPPPSAPGAPAVPVA